MSDIITYNILSVDKVRPRDTLQAPLHVEVGVNPFGSPSTLMRWARKSIRGTKTSVMHVTPATDVSARVAYGRFRRLCPEGSADIRYREFLTLVRAVHTGAVPAQDFLTLTEAQVTPQWSPRAYQGRTRSPGSRGSLARAGTAGNIPARGVSTSVALVVAKALIGRLAEIPQGLISSSEDIGDIIRVAQNASFTTKQGRDFSGFLDADPDSEGEKQTDLRILFPFYPETQEAEMGDPVSVTVPFAIKVRAL